MDTGENDTKMNNSDYSDIVSIVYTVDDVGTVLDELSLISQALFETKIPLSQVLHDHVRVIMVRALTQAFAKNGIAWNNIQQVETFLQGAAEMLKNLERIELTIAIEPTAGMIKRISAFVRQSFGQHTIVELHVDRTIIGGALIVHNGLYRDYSLKKRLPELLNENDLEHVTQKPMPAAQSE